MASIWHESMFGFLFLDITWSSKLTVFLELRSRKTVRFSEQMISGDKYPSIFSRQMETIVYISTAWQCLLRKADIQILSSFNRIIVLSC